MPDLLRLALEQLETLPPSIWLRRSGTLYLLVNAAHIGSIGLLIGSIVPLDLRLLGLIRPGPLAVLAPVLARTAAAGLALWTGRGEDNFVPGLITNAVYGTAFLISALIGWSLIGLAVGFLTNEGTAWRRDRRKRRVFFWLAIAWAALFFARLAVQLPLYLAGDVTTLGTLKLIMGLPLFAPLIAVTWLTVRALYPRSAPPSET